MRALQCLTLVAVVLIATALLGGPALAGDYHTGGQLICADCHTMHYSLSHTYQNATAPPAGTLAGGPNERLLKQPVNALCTSCHDGTSTAPDVVGNDTGTAYIRQAGALNWASGAGTNDTGYDTYMGHSLGSTAAAPGGTWSNTSGLSCTNCHGAHNRAAGDLNNTNTDINGHTHVSAWRNVSTRAGGVSSTNVISYETGTNSGAYDIFEPDPTLGQINVHYDIANETLNEPVSTDSGVSTWCKRCHTDFHSTTTSTSSTGANYNSVSGDWLRHPTADANYSTSMWTQYTSHPATNRVPVMSANPAAQDATSTPTCTSCHKAHGNKNPFGLIEMSGSGTVTEEGDTGATGMRDLCKQCHSQGG